MRHTPFRAVALALLLLLGVGAVRAEDDEEEVALEDLPAAVVEAIEARFPDAELLEAEKEDEDGQIVYEVEIKRNGEELEVEVTAGGEILEVEKDD